MSYVQGFIIPVPESQKDAYLKFARETAPYFLRLGASRIVECWGDQVPRGRTTDMYRAVNAEEGEAIVFSWIDWPSKHAWDEAHQAIGKDPSMGPPSEIPFDGKRMIYAGFEPLGEGGASQGAGYVQGYVAPVSKRNREAFSEMCARMREIALACGALRAIDSWAEDIQDGDVTDFKRAVGAENDEAVAFGFTEWASKDACETGLAKMRQDARMPPPGSDMPLDGRRMIFGGFSVVLDVEPQ